MDQYEVTHSTWDHEETERMVAATLLLTGKDWDLMFQGAPVIKRIPEGFSFKLVVETDSEGSVLFHVKKESRA